MSEYSAGERLNVMRGHLLQLVSLDGVGRIAIKNLIDHFGDIESIFKVPPEEISKVTGLNRKKAVSILQVQDQSDSAVSKELEEIESRGYRLYCYGDREYPKLLSEIPDPPAIFYSRGEIRAVDFNAVAIVGTRKASQYGRNIAKLIAKKLAVNNITVVSGCAVGIDTWAHRGAIEGGGRTIAVLGSGLDEEYPKENTGLMEKISGNGAVISEFPLGTKPLPYNFPRRNRVISGLSLGVVVVEAPSKSGALITAYQAIDQGRAVYSIPGSIFSAKSRGCNDLIKQGAIPVTEAEEIIEDLEPLLDKSLLVKREKEFTEQMVSERGKQILDIMSREPLHIDMIRIQTKIDINMLARELTNLEMMGKISQVGGKRYVKNG